MMWRERKRTFHTHTHNYHQEKLLNSKTEGEGENVGLLMIGILFFLLAGFLAFLDE